MSLISWYTPDGSWQNKPRTPEPGNTQKSILKFLFIPVFYNKRSVPGTSKEFPQFYPVSLKIKL